jgi:hypothetical protein
MSGAAENLSDLDTYLIGFVHRISPASEQFLRLADPYLSNLARSLAFDLPSDLHKDIVEQTYVNLLAGNGARFDPELGSAKAFLYDTLRNAIRQVRAQYCSPGQTTRNRKSCFQEEHEGDLREKSTIISTSEMEELAATCNTANQIMARCDAQTILNKAPRQVAEALYRIHIIGEFLDEVAHHLGTDRFKLRRLINAYCMQFRQVT